MDAKNLFKPHFFVLKLIGMKLQYTDSRKDKAFRFLSISANFVMWTSIFTVFHYIFTPGKSFEGIAEIVPNFFSAVEFFFKWSILYFRGANLKALIFDLKELLFESMFTF